MEGRFAKRAKREDDTSSVELASAASIITENHVVTPLYINKSAGVTTKLESQTQEKLNLKNQDLQTGVAILGAIASTEAVEELDIFDDWTPHQKRQLWQVVPQWLKQKLHSLIDGLRGCDGRGANRLRHRTSQSQLN